MNGVYSKEGLLFLVQVDHLSGELLGSAIEYLYACGARNVQMLPSVTKKNRPGHAVLIDAPVNLAQDIERVIVEELASTGWHRFSTEHRHMPVESTVRPVKIIVGSCQINYELGGKQIKHEPESVRPEHSSCLKLQCEVKNMTGLDVPLTLIYAKALCALRMDLNDGAVINFQEPKGMVKNDE